MVDVATFNIMYSSRSRADKVDDTYDKWPQRIEASKEMPPDCELLLPNVIEAFHLDSKKWSKSLAIYDTNSIYKVLLADRGRQRYSTLMASSLK